MIAWVTFGALAALSVSAFVWLRPLHPAQLWLIPWTAAVGLFALHLLPYRTLSAMTAALIVGSACAFAAGSLAGERLAAHAPKREEAIRTPLASVLVLTLATALLFLAFLAQISARFGFEAALVSSVQVRTAVGDGSVQWTIKYVYFALAAIAVAATTAAVSPRRLRLPLAGLTALLVASLYFSTGRSTIVTGLIIGAFAFAISRKRQLSRVQLGILLAALVATATLTFYVGGRIIGKTYENNPDLIAYGGTFNRDPRLHDLALPYQYMTAPVAALDVLVGESHPLGSTHGCTILRELCTSLERLGFETEGVPRVRPFTSPPLAWNTYTGLDAPLLDGGFIFTIPIVALLGIAIGWVAKRATQAEDVTLSRVAYALVTPALLYSAGSFNFTAPHLVGALIACAFVVMAASILQTRMASLAPRRAPQ
jgi:hypothetical protein